MAQQPLNMTNIYAPDPLNTGMYKLVSQTSPWDGKISVNVKCDWCKSLYSNQREQCPNCGGPRTHE